MQLNLYLSNANFQGKSASNIVYLIMVPSGALGQCIASLNAVKDSNLREKGISAKHRRFACK